MAKTLVAMGDDEFNIRACPIWAIPQLMELQRRTRGKLLELQRRTRGKLLEFRTEYHGIGTFYIRIPDEGVYVGTFISTEMNRFRMPTLFPMPR